MFSAFIRYLTFQYVSEGDTEVTSIMTKPSAVLFQVFDRLLLLRKGGQTVFHGDIGGNSTSLIHYFEKNGSRTCKPDENPYVSH
jgi:ATP-binding cassette, subfamily G (WHITE), member 2, SNQ2